MSFCSLRDFEGLFTCITTDSSACFLMASQCNFIAKKRSTSSTIKLSWSVAMLVMRAQMFQPFEELRGMVFAGFNWADYLHFWSCRTPIYTSQMTLKSVYWVYLMTFIADKLDRARVICHKKLFWNNIIYFDPTFHSLSERIHCQKV